MNVKKLGKGQLKIFIMVIFLGMVLPFPATGQDEATSDTSSLSLKEALKENRYPLHLADGDLKGEGGVWLKKQASEAAIVMLGEMHATQEIPAVMNALISDLQETGEADHLALEVSPWSVEQMTDSLSEGKSAYNRLIEEYPSAIPFYNFENERDLLHQFVQSSDKKRPLWGLDQIFAFSTDMAFDRLVELAPTLSAKKAVESVRQLGKSKSADDPRLQKLPPGIPTPITVYEPVNFDTLRSHFKGIPEARQILSELQKSIKIYRLNDEDNYRSNQIRARYLRDNLRQSFQQADRPSNKKPQVVIKAGAFHAYKGMTPNNALDIGNLSVSLARAMGGEALNVAVLCGPGSQSRSFPAQTVDCWSDRLGEDLKSLSKEQPVLFDLTALHPLLHEGTVTVGEELGDFLWAFDAVVLIPNTVPAKPVASPVKQ
ncbi:ChaN family lipoprotein [Fodinibius sp.]|uniref:ChaN family lipoprotein n=1 Tax=Fodinibius sp. TaxID=1872440 RepID=UPI002ACEB74A|nr:ChaN family lipoprotein [Fodinibius sp.]MDZ7659690.1 ChaN family lipoprotein [Fodinibius sp.]